jgi:hypothetical protein
MAGRRYEKRHFERVEAARKSIFLYLCEDCGCELLLNEDQWQLYQEREIVLVKLQHYQMELSQR